MTAASEFEKRAEAFQREQLAELFHDARSLADRVDKLFEYRQSHPTEEAGTASSSSGSPAPAADGFADKVFECRRAVEAFTAEATKAFGELLGPEVLKLDQLYQQLERAKHRRAVVMELATTELSYLEDLTALELIWHKEIARAGLLTPQEESTMFGDVHQFVALSTQLVSEFTSASHLGVPEQRIGEAFKKRIPFFRMYSTYAIARDQVNDLVLTLKKNPKLVAITEKHRARLKNLELPDYLIKPLQRIVKYPLLLKDLIHDTEPSHPDYANLEEAQEAMKKVLFDINKATRNYQTMQLLSKLVNSITWLDKPYDFVAARAQLVTTLETKSELLSTRTSGDLRANVVYVFTTIVLACQQKPGKWQEVAIFSLLDCEAKDTPLAGGANSGTCTVTITNKCNNDVLVCYFMEHVSKNHFLATFQEALEQAKEDAKPKLGLKSLLVAHHSESDLLIHKSYSKDKVRHCSDSTDVPVPVGAKLQRTNSSFIPPPPPQEDEPPPPPPSDDTSNSESESNSGDEAPPPPPPDEDEPPPPPPATPPTERQPPPPPAQREPPPPPPPALPEAERPKAQPLSPPLPQRGGVPWLAAVDAHALPGPRSSPGLPPRPFHRRSPSTPVQAPLLPLRSSGPSPLTTMTPPLPSRPCRAPSPPPRSSSSSPSPPPPSPTRTPQPLTPSKLAKYP
eukprot:TRINITY_DN17203_c0_g1_i1.p1 TRINITY_DN17203_c0_g1~~TRINITY_DN17203_c0_g1_i1.p1  ORF type:complete len:699 (+),score=206.66 TRINITY_DN17203_c0_g1_i1:55-2097(+)